jgi:hypothetical protein
MIIEVDETEVIRRRRDGQSCLEVSRAMHVPEWKIWRVMSSNGMAGQYRKLKSNKANRSTLEKILDIYDEISIERGCTGGYIATIDDAVFGEECDTPMMAIRNAFKISKL